MLTTKTHPMFIITAILSGFASSAFAADRGTVNSGETKIGRSISGPSYLDTWTFQGNAGDQVIINAVTTLGSFDTEIVLYPPDGGPAEARSRCVNNFGEYRGCDDQLDVQLQKTGEYYIVIQDYQVNHSGTYNIGLLKIPGAVSFFGDPDGGPMASGETLYGTINVASDMDAFQFYGAAGDRVIINAVTTLGSLDTEIVLYPPDGGPAEARSRCVNNFGEYRGCDDQLDVQIQHTGLYTIVIQDFGVNHSGTYNISLAEILRPGLYNPSPPLGDTLTSSKGSFSWDPIAGATGYDLYLGTDGMTPLVKIGDNLPSPTMPWLPPGCGKRYYWHVVAHTAPGDIQGPYWWFDAPCAETTGWFEDFESYNLETFPYPGGWGLFYDGGNQANQYVDNTHAVSPTKSLHLVGSAEVPAVAYRPVGLMSREHLEADVFVQQRGSCGISPTWAALGLRNLKTGMTFGAVRFSCDGNIYAVKDNLSVPVTATSLMAYNAGQWYRIVLEIDLIAKRFDVYIDGTLKGSGLEILNTETRVPNAVYLAAGYGISPTIWFDDVRVSPAIVTECNDGIDNDGDGKIDFKGGAKGTSLDNGGDPGCYSPEWSTESPACDDGIDNDCDGSCDWNGDVRAVSCDRSLCTAPKYPNYVANAAPDSFCVGSPYAPRTSEVPLCGLLGIEPLALVAWALARRRRSAEVRA